MESFLRSVPNGNKNNHSSCADGILALVINPGIKFQLFRVQAYNALNHSLIAWTRNARNLIPGLI